MAEKSKIKAPAVLESVEGLVSASMMALRVLYLHMVEGTEGQQTQASSHKPIYKDGSLKP